MCLRFGVGRPEIEWLERRHGLAAGKRDLGEGCGTRLKLRQLRLDIAPAQRSGFGEKGCAAADRDMQLAWQRHGSIVGRDQQRAFAPLSRRIEQPKIEHAAPGIDGNGVRSAGCETFRERRLRHHAEAVDAE